MPTTAHNNTQQHNTNTQQHTTTPKWRIGQISWPKMEVPPKLFSHLYLLFFFFFSFFPVEIGISRKDVCFFFLLFLTFFFLFLLLLLDPIPGPEERFTCSQFCAYFAFSFSLCVFVFFLVVAVHAQFMHARWFTAAFRLSFCDCHKKPIASW